ncbi:hypothetical protein RLOatenuis_2810 [Rickettsiales bacterium]|nr:hypothetical protein RLOatenuis_2810 [Rickettsiales bacterium]
MAPTKKGSEKDVSSNLAEVRASRLGHVALPDLSVHYATLLVKALAKFAKDKLNKKIIKEALLYKWEYMDLLAQELEECIVIESLMPLAAKA